MVKTKILRSGKIRNFNEESFCRDMGHNLIKVGDAEIGDFILIAEESERNGSVAEILEKSPFVAKHERKSV